MLFDSHSHPHFAAYKDESDDVIKRALEHDIHMLAVGTHFETSCATIACAEKYNGVWASIGLHPIHVSDGYFDPNEDAQPVAEKVAGGFRRRAEVYDKEAYRALARTSKKVVAIGECGLDYYRLEGDEAARELTKAKQSHVFRQQAELAAELDLALVVHCRNSSPAEQGERGRLQAALPTGGGDVSPIRSDAHADVFEILRDVKIQHPTLRGVIHCFTGTREEAERHLTLGFYISFSGIITFAHDWDDFIRETPLDRLLVETDCPYLTPVPNRGKRNEPAYVEYTARHMAEIRGESFDHIAQVTFENSKKLFRI